MDILNIIKKRKSVRKYKNKKIPKKILIKILDSARFAPSAFNAQDWKFILVSNKQKINEIAKICQQNFIKQAPHIIVGIGTNPKQKMECGIPNYIVDLSIALDHLMLSATSKKLGTCWIGGFKQNKIKKLLKIPLQYQVVGLMTIGFSNDITIKTSRKKMKEIIIYEEFNEI